jgi:hypothetical protein
MAEARETQSRDDGAKARERQLRPPMAEAPALVADSLLAPMGPVLGGDFGAAAFSRHASLLSNRRLSHPANASQRAKLVGSR